MESKLLCFPSGSPKAKLPMLSKARQAIGGQVRSLVPDLFKSAAIEYKSQSLHMAEE